MPLTTCNQKEFLIKSKLCGFWKVFLLYLDLEIFIGEREDEVKRDILLDNFFVKLCE